MLKTKLSEIPQLIKIEKPGRYTDGEWNASRKEISEKDCAFALCYPDSYEIAQSGLGLKIIYHVVNNHKRARGERVFAPLPDMEDFLRRENLSIFSLETASPINRFDIIGFSLQYQMTYTNILNVLDLAQIPLYSKNRSENHPLIIAGGPCAFNPEPVADFFDAILIGDGEEAVPEIIDVYLEWKDGGKKNRDDLLEKLAKIQGVYVPSFYKIEYDKNSEIIEIKLATDGIPRRVKKRVVPDLDSAQYPDSPAVPFIETVHDRVMLEIARGCTRGCRFCNAGFIYRPVRERSVENIAKMAHDSLKSTGYDEISLLSLSCTDYSRIEALVKGLSQKYEGENISVSLPSLRMDNFSLDIVNSIKSSRSNSLTFAPEAGTQRLRDVINKNVSDEDFISTLQKARKLGWSSIKLYFMIGLPTETQEDIDGLIKMVRLARQITKMKFHVSASNFVPQPYTPFQWEEFADIKDLQEKAYYIKNALKDKNIKFNYHEPKVSFLEGVFARGDRRLAGVIEAAFRLGCRFDGWNEYFNYEKWMQAFDKCGVDPNRYTQARHDDEILPWDHIEAGVSKKYLQKEREKAYQGISSKDCRNGCTGCGICPNLSVSNKIAPEISDKDGETKNAGEICLNPINKTLQIDKVLLKLARQGAVKWISHLDAQRSVERALRRGGIPVSYSEGFHPRPKISFLLPCPTGYESEAEWIEIALYKEMEPCEIESKLKKVLPEGLKVIEVKRPLMTKITTKDMKVKYSVNLPQNNILSEDKIEVILKDFIGSVEFNIQKKNKSQNVRPLLNNIKLANEENHKKIVMEIFAKKDGTVKPDILVSALFGDSVREGSIYRREEVLFLQDDEWVSL